MAENYAEFKTLQKKYGLSKRWQDKVKRQYRSYKRLKPKSKITPTTFWAKAVPNLELKVKKKK